MSQTSGANRSSPLPDGASTLLRSYPVAALDLPAHSERWGVASTVCDQYGIPRATDPVCALVDRFREHHIVEVVERLPVSSRKTTRRRNVYRTARGVVPWIDANVPQPTTFPCGHQGLRNLGDGRYTCGSEECDREFSREVAEAVFGRGSA